MIKKTFIYFEAMKRSYLERCRPILVLDRYHLKGSFGGLLLCTIFVDGNKRLFPVAHDVVEIKCKNSWRFLLEHLYLCICGVIVDNTLIIIFDKQKAYTLSYFMFKHFYKCFDNIIWFMLLSFDCFFYSIYWALIAYVVQLQECGLISCITPSKLIACLMYVWSLSMVRYFYK